VRPGIERGYVKLFRSIEESGLLQHPNALAVLIYFLIAAPRSDYVHSYRGEAIHLKAGQIVFGRRRLAERLKMTERTLRSALKLLTERGTVTIMPTRRYSIATLQNFKEYQAWNGEKQPTERPAERPATRPSNRPQIKRQKRRDDKQDAARTLEKPRPRPPLVEPEPPGDFERPADILEEMIRKLNEDDS
jgi:hypothetical protein